MKALRLSVRARVLFAGLALVALLAGIARSTASSATASTSESADPDVLRRENLVAWCIVPFDAKKRTPAERAAMLKELGFKRCAYDWREEHVPTFEQEILEYKQQGIEFFAFWGVHEDAFQLFKKHDIHPQIWQMMGEPAGSSQEEKVRNAAAELEPLATRTKELGCQLGLYNHGGWGGEPDNMVAVCQRLRAAGHDNVGIVYNFHHGHGHIQDWPQAFAKMQPLLLCLNLNGMNDNAQPLILGIGNGEHEREMIRTVIESGYSGPIGVLDHRDELDARKSLQENLDGLEQLRQEFAAAKQNGQPEPAAMAQPHAAHPDATHAAATHQHATAQDAGANINIDAATEIPYDPQLVAELVGQAQQSGNAVRGARVFTNVRLACVSCHKVGQHGGTVGPELTAIAKDRPLEKLVESLLWPQREVKPEYMSWQVLTADGRIHTGFKHSSTEQTLTLRDPASGELIPLDRSEIEDEAEAGTVMPAGLTVNMSRQQTLDIIRFLSQLGKDDQPLAADVEHALAVSQLHGPADFPIVKTPLDPSRWPHAGEPVNRDRIYDFYTKQAEHFRQRGELPMLLTPYPGLDGGTLGHWGNQDENYWADDRWNATQLGSVQAGVLHGTDASGNNFAIARAVCVQLGEEGELSACFDPDTLSYPVVWSQGFLKLDSVRHGLLGGLLLDGEVQPAPPQQPPTQPVVYHGFYRVGKRVVFAYRVGDVEYLDSPWLQNGKFVREVAPANEHSLRDALRGGSPQWPQVLETEITPGTGKPYAVDTIGLPFDNPWKAMLFCGGHDFLPDGSALVCTMQGDVWHVSGIDGPADQPGVARWRRFASGLHHPLGLLVSEGKIYVQCRDQLMRLTDLNGDGEADFYECINRAFQTSPAGHDFICGLQRDAAGNFYTASGNQGVLRLSADGQRAEVLATGFRNPDGLGLMPDGMLTLPVSEGNWTPASAICALVRADAHTPAEALHFGYGGPRNNEPPALPLVYLPRGMDNSSGEQVFVTSDKFGPLRDQMLHLSFGTGTWYTALRDEVDGQPQGAIVPMSGDFSSGTHRGRFNPADGQLYVSGMLGWGSYTSGDGCFQRVRYTGDPVQTPTGFHVHENGIVVTFALPLDPQVAENIAQHYAQCWNYRFSGAYGSPEYSPMHPGTPGHDPLEITAAHVLPDGRSLFLEIPELQPVSQLHLRLHVNNDDKLTCSPTGTGHDLFLTVHKLDRPFADYPGYYPLRKTIAAHPLLVDMSLNDAKLANPWAAEIADARPIEIKTGANLTYQTREFKVKAGEALAFTLNNPDVVPHNWVLVAPGALRTVGELGNRLIAEPDAYARHYVPESDQVLAHTDIVSPGEKQTIYFQAPTEPGRYPFLCTFPGHWMVMNGVMVVE